MADTTTEEPSKVPKKRFIGRRIETKEGDGRSIVKTASGNRHIGRTMNQIPEEILNDEDLNRAIELLPSNYNFEIHKTVWNIKRHGAKRVALQMPEGLLIYSLVIADILEQFCQVEVVVMGDVTYGACCIDDYTAKALNCEFIVHYAHSCLVPIDVTRIKVLYVFVTININEKHLVNTLKRNFDKGAQLAVFGTIQFNPTIHSVKAKLENDSEKPMYLIPPQTMPLSKGEVLGCTSARLNREHIQAMIYIGDGRFHLESSMIHNPEIPAFKYDPYSQKFTREYYDQDELLNVREGALRIASKSKKIGLILGSLGRQGNPITLDRLESRMQSNGIEVVKIVLSEILPQKLCMFDDIDAFVQVACPRLSIDWGYAFDRPLLTPYEAMVMLGGDYKWDKNTYPMDYYSRDGYGRGRIPQHAKSNI